MAHKSTGVFRVPVMENGVAPTALNIMLNNDSNHHSSKVTVIVKRSPNVFFPAVSDLVEISRTHVSLAPNQTTKIVIFTPNFVAEDFLDITIRGEVGDLEDMLVYSFLADSTGQNLPSTVFRNEEYTMGD